MPYSEKITAVAELAEHLSNSSAAVITEYRGLSVKQLTDLRLALGRGTTYAIVKNTLTKRAAVDAGVTIDEALLRGPTAIAFVKGDAVEAAKGLRDFARTNPLLVIKGGLIDGKAVSASEIAQIADLESREVLLARLAGALKALPSRAASLFQAPLSQMARLAKALEEKKPAETASVAEPEVTAVESAVVAGQPAEASEAAPAESRGPAAVATGDPVPSEPGESGAVGAGDAAPAEKPDESVSVEAGDAVETAAPAAVEVDDAAPAETPDESKTPAEPAE